ncbi:MAG: hypothetical protein HN909_08785 [Phycisphaerales bacterium]|jgi:uncharacterized protein|nr:hypothetical protein [Phycisphaerales bacterium]MBT7171846.1 hypothetical protein [Phycisphaerales bacterium]
MSLHEKIGVLILLAIILIIGMTAGVFFLRAIWNRWFRHEAKPLGRRARKLRTASWTLSLIGLCCLGWSFYEPYWPEVTHTVIESDKLAGLTKPIRLVQLSDFHCDATRRAEDTVIETVRDLKPDLIVLTGDYTNSPAGADTFRSTLNALVKIAPTYLVRGNWDYYHPSCRPWENTGATVLDGRAAAVCANGVVFRLAGAGHERDDEIQTALDALASRPAGQFGLMLYHHTRRAREIAASGHVDLLLAGHTHGGQLCLPVYGAVVTLSGEGKSLEAGRYQLGDTTLYIHRGIGMEGGRAPRIRFLARPEIALIELRGTK